MHAGPHVFPKGLGHEAPLVVSFPALDPGVFAEVVIVRERNPFWRKLEYATKTSLRPDSNTLVVRQQYETWFVADSACLRVPIMW
jgi:hypothetical protein